MQLRTRGHDYELPTDKLTCDCHALCLTTVCAHYKFSSSSSSSYYYFFTYLL